MELIKIEDTTIMLDLDVSKEIVELENKIKKLKEQEEKIKETILKEMEDKKILKLETDNLIISYVAQSERETFDSKRFREKNSDLYDEYVKFTPVKSSIRFKVK